MFPTIEQMNATAAQFEREAVRLRAERDAMHTADARRQPRKRMRVALPALRWMRPATRRMHA